jgi:NADPH-dependent 2,4-dienoyl-CoA reductase/sulfur reductase-like enzyme/rhodanese-related sulfurtransferase
VGGGFIGLEVVEQLARRNVATGLVELLPQVMPPLDAEMVAPIHRALADKGVDVHLRDGVALLDSRDGQVVVRLTSGEELTGDLVVLAIGVRPDTQLAREAGLELNERGAIRVDSSQRTSDPAIYAVGDAVEVREPVFGTRTYVPLGGPANRQGRLAADHMAYQDGAAEFQGVEPRYRGTQGTSIVRVFDVVVGMTGMSEKALVRLGKQQGTDFDVVYAHPSSHASYYPGATPMMLKLLYEKPSGRVLGAQAVGRDGIDKRIDVIAMAIQMQATVYDLEQAELCYAPPFGSAKDPVNFVGFLAANALRGHSRPVQVRQLDGWLEEGKVTVLDVRTTEEFQEGAIGNVVHVPLHELRDRVAEVPRDKPVVTYCRAGLRGYLAERILAQSGFTGVSNLSGGYLTWRAFHAD